MIFHKHWTRNKWKLCEQWLPIAGISLLQTEANSLPNTRGGGTTSTAELPAQFHHSDSTPSIIEASDIPWSVWQPCWGNIRLVFAEIFTGSYAWQKQVKKIILPFLKKILQMVGQNPFLAGDWTWTALLVRQSFIPYATTAQESKKIYYLSCAREHEYYVLI